MKEAKANVRWNIVLFTNYCKDIKKGRNKEESGLVREHEVVRMYWEVKIDIISEWLWQGAKYRERL